MILLHITHNLTENYVFCTCTGIETQPPTIQHQSPYHHAPPHQIPLQHHLQSHHQSPDCETPSPFRYQNVYQQSPPTQMQSSSAFCAIPQPDASGKCFI